jgi:chemotaxis protein MotA
MFVIIGWIVVCVCIFGGFIIAGGSLASIWHPIEIVVIGGGAVGAMIAANGKSALNAIVKALPGSFKPPHATKALYMELLACLFEILSKVRKEGLMSVESDVEDPEKSAIFTKYPLVSHDHHIIEFVTDYLRMMVGGNLNAFEIEALMDQELETHHDEAHVPISAIAKLADSLPAFGIVACVLGVVKTMGALHLPPKELGPMIGTALTGTFLGILMAYGFVAPLAGILESKMNEEGKIYACIKFTLLSSLNGYAPQVAVEFGRKVLFSTDRPSFKELEDHVKSTKGK